MSSVSTTCYPSSFQLRFAFNCRKSPQPVTVRFRFQKLDRQFRVLSVARDAERSGNGVATTRPGGSSWVNSNSSADDFSGWSGANGSEGPLFIEYQRKQWLGGIIKAGVAGVVLVAGLTFAALSISKRNSSGAKEMEPLTTQQEVSLASDEENDRVEEDGNKGRDVTGDDSSLGSETGIDKDSSLYTESNEATIENRVINDTGAGYSIDDGDVIKNASNKDLQNESAIDDLSVASDASLDTFKLPASDIDDGSSVASKIDDVDGNLVTENAETESTTELKKNPTDAVIMNSSFNDAKPVIINEECQDGVPGTGEIEGSNASFSLSSSSADHVHSESLIANQSVNSQEESVLETQIVEKESTDTVNWLSSKEDLDLSKTTAEGDKSSLEEHNLNGSGSSESTSVSAVAYPFAKEQDDNDHNDIDGSRSFFETTNPWNSFSSAGIPAPSLVSAALQVLPGKVLVPATVDQVQAQALTALQVLKVIEADAQPGDLCTRREYARWLVSASSALSRNSVSKVYPAMYIENVTELAFDDITPEDPDFPSIQGLAEAGLISSKLSRRDLHSPLDEDQNSLCFSPESPLSRQDLVTWKMVLERRQLPEADRKILHQVSGFIDIDKINPDAWPALVADLSTGDQGIIALAFGYTRLFQPDKPVTKAQAAVALAAGEASDIVGEELARIEAESMADNAVAAHSALVAQVEKDVNATFEKELLLEREKIDAVERLAEAARAELETLRAKREEDKIALMKERAAVESEMEVLSRLRHEVEEQLQSLMSNKVEISYEKERFNKLREEAEVENQVISRLQYELEVERKALSMARAWAEDEAKRAREQAKSLEVARDRWERHGIKVVVDNDLTEEANAGVTWLNAGQQFSVEGTVNRAENLVDKLKAMAADVRGKSREIIGKIIEKVLVLVSVLKEWVSEKGRQTGELKDVAMNKVGGSVEGLQQKVGGSVEGLQQKVGGSVEELQQKLGGSLEGLQRKVGGSLVGLQQSSAEFTSALKEGAKRVAGECRGGVEKITQKFKT